MSVTRFQSRVLFASRHVLCDDCFFCQTEAEGESAEEVVNAAVEAATGDSPMQARGSEEKAGKVALDEARIENLNTKETATAIAEAVEVAMEVKVRDIGAIL